jgi:hypothetical protein
MTEANQILSSTPVVFKEPIHHTHPFFCSIRRNCAEGFPVHFHEKLLSLETQLNLLLCQEGALGVNQSYDLGIRVKDEGKMKDGSSFGTLDCGKIIRQRDPILHNQLMANFEGALCHAFGDKPWYKRMQLLCKQLKLQTGESRTIGNMPISCIRRMSIR